MREIIYIVRQQTTAPARTLPDVVDRFDNELRLQFGSTIDVEVADIRSKDRRETSLLRTVADIATKTLRMRKDS